MRREFMHSVPALICLTLVLPAAVFVEKAGAPVGKEKPTAPARLESFGRIDQQNQLLADTEITIAFAEDGQIRGNGGCNSYLATWNQEEEGGIRITDLAHTERACVGPGILEQETIFFEALRDITHCQEEGNRLKLFYDDRQSVLTFIIPPVATVEAKGKLTTTWGQIKGRY